MPIKLKENQQTVIGKLDIGVRNALEVSTTYKMRGTVKDLVFDDIDDILTKTKISQILSDVKKDYRASLARKAYDYTTRFMFPIAHYELPLIALIPLTSGDTVIRMMLWCYDEEDARFVARKKTNDVKDVLTSYFSSSFIESSDEEGKQVRTDKNVFVEDIVRNVNDEFAMFEGQYYIPEKLLLLLNKIIENDELDMSTERFVKAARLYRSGIKLEDLGRRAVGQDVDYSEVVMVNYMSVLEVLSIDDSTAVKSCDACGQLRFTIASRVRDLASKSSGNNSRFIRYINKSYQDRSKFLHEGVFMSTDSYSGTSIPQVSKSEDGVEYQTYYCGSLRYDVANVMFWVLDNILPFSKAK